MSERELPGVGQETEDIDAYVREMENRVYTSQEPGADAAYTMLLQMDQEEQQKKTQELEKKEVELRLLAVAMVERYVSGDPEVSNLSFFTRLINQAVQSESDQKVIAFADVSAGDKFGIALAMAAHEGRFKFHTNPTDQDLETIGIVITPGQESTGVTPRSLLLRIRSLTDQHVASIEPFQAPQTA